MAKKQKTEQVDLLKSDFLGDMSEFNKSTGSNIWEKQAALYRQEVVQPFTDFQGFANAFNNVYSLMSERDEERKEKLRI